MEHGSALKKLDKIKEENIIFSKHANDNLKIRGFSKDSIIKILKDTENVIDIELQKDEKPGKKYKLWVKRSSKYNFVIVINIFNGKIKIVTFHLESRKRMKRLKKWLKK